MKLNFPFLAHLKYRLYVYIGVFVGISALTCLSITLATNPKKYEKFQIFVGADFTNKDGFINEINGLLKEDLEVKIEALNESDSLFNTKFNTFGKTSDIIIVSKTIMDTQDNVPYVTFSQGDKYYSDLNYSNFERCFGILLNGNENNYLSKYFSLKDEPYYAFVSQKTVHGEHLLNTYSTDQVDRVLTLLLN